MHRLPQPVPVPDRNTRDFDHAQQAASTITTYNHHHHNFAPMAFESSDPEATSLSPLSDILDNLPSAVKSSLGPLNTIRRSVSIRGWASYFYEISSNTMGASASHLEGPSAAAAAAAHRTTVVSRTTSTTAVEMQQHSNRGEKRVAAPAQAQRRPPEPPLYEEPDQNFGINRFCGLQGKTIAPPPFPPTHLDSRRES